MIYAVSSCCGSTLDSLCDPHVYVEHGLTTEFYCTERKCLAEAFGETIDDIFGIFQLAPEVDEQLAVYCPHQFKTAAE